MSLPYLTPSIRVRRTPFSRRVEEAGVKAFSVYNHMLIPQFFRSPEEDYSHLKQAGLDLARQRALAQGSQIETMSVDLEVDSLPEGPFDLITCFNYRQRNLFPSIRERLKIGGSLLAEIAIVTNLERHAHPSLRYLGQLGELRQDCAPLEILYYQEGWFDDRASARVLARRVA